MFCVNTDLANEYISFGDEDIYEVEDQRQWLNDELELVAPKLCANHLSTLI
jgi:hypothetical protein